MYADAGLVSPQFDGFCFSQKPNASLSISSSLVQTSTISDYNLGGAGDLFKAPEAIIQEPLMSLDPMEAAISMISCGKDVMSTQLLTVSDIESSIESGQLVSEVFYECRNDLLAKEGNQIPLSEILSISIPSVKADEDLFAESSFQKSASSNYLEYPFMDSSGVYGMRRAFSEGGMKINGTSIKNWNHTLNKGNINNSQSNLSPREPPSILSSSENRMEQLSRYRSKRSKRNFGRKIKYACRKTLADSQPRIRGRFAKT